MPGELARMASKWRIDGVSWTSALKKGDKFSRESNFWLISILWQWPPYLIHTDIDILMSNITVTQLKQIRQIINGRELLRIRMFLVYV